MGFVCVEGRWRFSCIISGVIQVDYVVGSYANWFFGVFSRFCSISPAFFSLGKDGLVLCRAGCLVVVLVLASAFLHVKISVKVFRVYLGMVTSFWSTFVLEGVM